MKWVVLAPKTLDAFSYPAELEEYGLALCRYGYVSDDGSTVYCALGIAREDVVQQVRNAEVVEEFETREEAFRYMEWLWSNA